jgi:hypothetical protein
MNLICTLKNTTPKRNAQAAARPDVQETRSVRPQQETDQSPAVSSLKKDSLLHPSSLLFPRKNVTFQTAMILSDFDFGNTRC